MAVYVKCRVEVEVEVKHRAAVFSFQKAVIRPRASVAELHMCVSPTRSKQWEAAFACGFARKIVPVGSEGFFLWNAPAALSVYKEAWCPLPL